MSMSSTRPDEDRRLLNTVYDYGSQHRTVKTALADANCSVDNVKALVRLGLIRADDDDVSIPAERVRATTEMWLALTTIGTRWVKGDQENLFLRTLDAATRQEGKLHLRRALQVADRDRITTTVEQGYAAMVLADTLQERVLRPRMFEPVQSWAYALVATPKIRQVLGPK